MRKAAGPMPVRCWCTSPPSNGCGSVPHWGHFHRCSVNTGVYTFGNECISETEWALEWSFYAVADNAKCSTYRTSCPAGYHFDDGAAGVECSAPDTCANDEVEHCCDANDACSVARREPRDADDERPLAQSLESSVAQMTHAP